MSRSPARSPAKTTPDPQAGREQARQITLDPVLPPGQLRARRASLVTGQADRGRDIKVEPGGKTATGGGRNVHGRTRAGSVQDHGVFPGLKDQELDVTIDPNGVAIKNIDLRR